MHPLTDQLIRPIQDLRISVIDRCNFRCPYCMPRDVYHQHYTFLKEKEWLTFDEITRLVKIFLQLGVTKVRLTGGEPLLRPHLTELIRRLAPLPGIEDLALTTNGSLLSQCAGELKKAGLKRLTVSLDSLNADEFRYLSGFKGALPQVLEGIKTAETCGFSPLKINVVIQKGVNDEGILNLARYFKGTPHILRFIEYMDVGNCNHWDYNEVMPSREIVKLIHAHFPIEPLKANYLGEVASRYRYVDGSGEVGFISSISQPFCGSCTRARLSTDGKLFTCLFASEGHDLKTPLRQGAADSDILKLIEKIWQRRDDRYSELRLSESLALSHSRARKVEMFQIGG